MGVTQIGSDVRTRTVGTRYISLPLSPATNCERPPFWHADSFSNFRRACPVRPSAPSHPYTPNQKLSSRRCHRVNVVVRPSILYRVWTMARVFYDMRESRSVRMSDCVIQPVLTLSLSLSLSPPLRVAIYVSCLSAVSASLTRKALLSRR